MKGKALRELEAEKVSLEQKIHDLRGRLKEINLKIVDEKQRQTVAAKQPVITDHALLRYFERKHGIDVEALRQEMLTKNVVEAIKLGADSIVVDGYRYMISENKVTTVLDKGMQPNRKNNP